MIPEPLLDEESIAFYETTNSHIDIHWLVRHLTSHGSPAVFGREFTTQELAEIYDKAARLPKTRSWLVHAGIHTEQDFVSTNRDVERARTGPPQIHTRFGRCLELCCLGLMCTATTLIFYVLFAAGRWEEGAA
jgi:hypothetical protein